MGFRDYISKLLDTPMIFINRNNAPINLNGRLTFRQYMEKGFEGFYPTMEDWKLHSNLYFPEVRLRNFLEIRNHDCVGNGLEFSIPALYKGIFYSKDAMDEVEENLNKYTINEIKELRYKVVRSAVNTKINGKSILPICKELAEISFYALKSEGEDEEKFLEPLIEILKKGKCPADI